MKPIIAILLISLCGCCSKRGVLGQDDRGNVIIDYHTYNELVSLVGDYGPRFKPPMLVHTSASPVRDYPVQLFVNGRAIGMLTNPTAVWPPGPGDWPYLRMDAQHFLQFQRMQVWRKDKIIPY